MNRLGLLAPDSLSSEQKELYDTFTQYTGKNYGDVFITKLPDGRFVGPFAVQLHTPEVGEHFLGFAKALRNIPGLPMRQREIAICVVAAHTQAAYERVAHERLSGLPQADLDTINKGERPSSFDEADNVVFTVATELFQPGPLKSSAWNDAVATFGKSGATALVHYVGFYKYVATILNGFDVEVPDENNLP